MPESNRELRLYETSGDEFIGREPGWLVQSGIALITGVMLLLLIISWFIRYPDALHARIKITSAAPPAELHARSSARIESVFVENGQQVSKNQVLMQLESDSHTEQVAVLMDYLEQDEGLLPQLDELGGIQESFNNWIAAKNSLTTHQNSHVYASKSKSLQELIFQYQVIIEGISEKISRVEQKRKLMFRELENNRSLFQQGVLSESALRPLERNYLEQQIEIDDINLEILRAKQQQEDAAQQLQLLKAQQLDTTISISNLVEEKQAALANALRKWRANYQITSPIQGAVSLVTPWNNNQKIEAGGLALYVVKPSQIIKGYMTLNHIGAGKIEVGQKVEIELDSYPAHEFGKLIGLVKEMALVAGENGYLVTVELPHKLETTYGIMLRNSPILVGNARILTKEMSFATRLINSITSINQ